jgi:cytochrome c
MAGRGPLSHGLVATGLLTAIAAAATGFHVRAGAVDPERGKAVFEKCAACHSLDDGQADGPSLKGVFGRKAGSLEDYRYSAAMKRSDVVWDEMTIDRYITDPQGFVKGNRMAFAGIPDRSEREDLIVYLKGATKP